MKLNREGQPITRNIFAVSDAWAEEQAVPRKERRRANGFAGWRAIAEMPVPTAAPKRGTLAWLRLAVRFRVHANDDRVWLIRPCMHVPDKWRSLSKWEPHMLPEALLLNFGWEWKQAPLPTGIGFTGPRLPSLELEQARRFVQALMVERDTWLEQGGNVRHTMRPFRWEDFVNVPAAGASKAP